MYLTIYPKQLVNRGYHSSPLFSVCFQSVVEGLNAVVGVAMVSIFPAFALKQRAHR